MTSYSGQDFWHVLLCGILCLLLYSACGLGYPSWFCLCKHWKYYIFIEMFIFNDVRKNFVRPQKYCTVNVSEEVCETHFQQQHDFFFKWLWVMIRKCTDCRYTPPSLRHQDLEPRVNRASYDMGVLCWNPIVEFGCCYRKMMASTGLWWWWNISEHIRNRSPDLFQFKYYCFVIMKGSASSQSTVKDWQQTKKWSAL